MWEKMIGGRDLTDQKKNNNEEAMRSLIISYCVGNSRSLS